MVYVLSPNIKTSMKMFSQCVALEFFKIWNTQKNQEVDFIGEAILYYSGLITLGQAVNN